jgi:phospho-N-acetylmuramoyl-pentapeptide-transferase
MQSVLFSVLISFMACLAVGPAVIPLMQKLKFGQVIREVGPKWHEKKSGTPQMGGLIMLIALGVTCLILIRRWEPSAVVGMGLILASAAIGFADDYIKHVMKRNMGLREWQKFALQVVVAGVAAVYAYVHIGTSVKLPFTAAEWDMGWFYIPFTMFVIVASLNAVNLTDGLDGLAAGVGLVYFAAVTFALLYITSVNANSIIGVDNYLTVAGALAGACLGFLRFNVFPARIFMGDTGSLALGAGVAWLAIVARIPLWLPVMAGMYVISVISDIIQVTSYKLRHKRVFKMAPIHHHFEMLGYPETRIVAMYMIVTAVLCMAGLLALR